MTDHDAHPERTVPCPWCGAPAGQRCTTRRGRPLTAPTHEARVEAWNATRHDTAATTHALTAPDEHADDVPGVPE